MNKLDKGIKFTTFVSAVLIGILAAVLMAGCGLGWKNTPNGAELQLRLLPGTSVGQQ